MRRLWGSLAICAFAGCHIFSGFSDLQFEEPPAAVPRPPLTRLTSADFERVDLLLAVDNSRGIADKQQILSQAINDLVEQLINPRCVNNDGTMASQPAEPDEACPTGTARPYAPVRDLHIGVITSSIGSIGADSCTGEAEPTENDRAHLISRSSYDGSTPEVETYQDLGFLAWDPDGTLSPPGESDMDAVSDGMATIVSGAGEVGCGWEASLEVWYRFLVQPDPYLDIQLEGEGAGFKNAVLVGVDDVLLAQRKAFLRPDSLLAIVNLTDENDCSIRAGGINYISGQIYAPGESSAYHLPRPRAACATDPNSDCCRSCGQAPGDGCDDANDDCGPALDGTDDPINLRCFDQKRRFGVDFRYDTDRYVDGLRSELVPDRDGNLLPNPIFTDLDPDDDVTGSRAAGLVFFAAVVGVPWQDIARRNENGDPDLSNGLDIDGRPVGGLQSGTELAENGVWAVILGDPDNYIAPTDPLMIESIDPRSGVNPITGDAIAPTTAGFLTNPINGHEYEIPQRNDLQHACIFPLPEPRDCEVAASGTSCACSSGFDGNPLCQDTSGGYSTVQRYARGLPAPRQLQVVKALGAEGLVGSICPAQLDDPGAADYGYSAALGALSDRLSSSLGSLYCLSVALPQAEDGADCKVIEARDVDDCECNESGRAKLGDEHLELVKSIKSDPSSTGDWNCFCEIEATSGTDRQACLNNTSEPVVSEFGYQVHGWCHVDTVVQPPIGNPAIAAVCPLQPRMLRFVGDGVPLPGATAWLSCDEQLAAD